MPGLPTPLFAPLSPSTPTTPMASGTLAVGTMDGRVLLFRPESGALIRTLTTQASPSYPVWGVAFDGAGNLYALLQRGTDNGTNPMTEKFEGVGFSSLGIFGTTLFTAAADFPYDIAPIPGGGFVVPIHHTAGAVHTIHLWKLDSSGNRTNDYGPASTDTTYDGSQQLKADVLGSTVYYTDMGRTVFRWDLGGGTQSSNFEQLPTDSTYIYGGVRATADGGIVVAMTASGDGPIHAVALDNGGASLWSDRTVKRAIDEFRVLDDSPIRQILTGLGNIVPSLAVFGQTRRRIFGFVTGTY